MTRAYELAVVLNPSLTDAEIERLIHSLKTLVEKHGGSITDEDEWGRKPTAYSLRGHNEGFYTFLEVTLPPDKVATLNQAVKLTDDVLRHLITMKEA